MPEKTELVDILKTRGALTPDQVSQIKLEQLNSGRAQADIIAERGWVPPAEVTAARAELIKVPFVDISTYAPSPEVLAKVPESVARHYTLIPVKEEGGQLQVAMEDPLDLQLIEFLEAKTGARIEPMLAVPEDITTAIEAAYATGIEKEVKAVLKETEKDVEKVEAQLKSLSEAQEVIQSAPVARIVSTILEYAVKARASDVHIEPEEGRTRVRFRIDGVLHERLSLPSSVHEAVVSRIKILSSLKIDEKRIPQDGRFMFEVGEQAVDLRVSTLPTSHGEKVVMRLLRKEQKVLSLEELGLRGRALKNFTEAIKKTHGIILITGPTGSGKTTTLRTVLSMKNSPEINIVTLEDPVEYEVGGVNQSQVNVQAGLTFASGLRSILRQDPDVIMVGEIRDEETMTLAVQAALTGHLVFSTLHTNSAAGALPRLLDMGAEPFLLSSTIEMVIAQRLVRRLNAECAEEYEPTEEVMQMLSNTLGPLLAKDLKSLRLLRPKKDCEEAFSGRVGIYEVLPLSERIARMITERKTADEIEHQAIKEGMVKMVQDGFLKAIEGQTTVEEVLRVAQE